MPVLNEAPFSASCSFEAGVLQGRREHTGMEGTNTGGFELRAFQESYADAMQDEKLGLITGEDGGVIVVFGS